MAVTEFSYIDEDGYAVALETDRASGRGVLIARSDSGTEVTVYLSVDAAQKLAEALYRWSAS